MDGGRLVARGSHAELLASNCLYAEIAASQLVGGTEVGLPDSCQLPEDGDR